MMITKEKQGQNPDCLTQYLTEHFFPYRWLSGHVIGQAQAALLRMVDREDGR